MQTKPGWQTTEFWISMASLISTCVAVSMGLTPNETADMSARAQTATVAVGTLITNTIVIWRYIKSRENVKEVEAEARVRTEMIKKYAETAAAAAKSGE